MVFGFLTRVSRGDGAASDDFRPGGHGAHFAGPEALPAVCGCLRDLAVIGALYLLPLALYFGDPLLTVHSYTTRDYGAAQLKGPHGHLFGWPLHGIIVGTILYPGPWTNLGLTFFWIILVLVGTCVMILSKSFREYAMAPPAETIFCGLYLFSIFSYDYLVWARSAFMRFCILTLPFIFLALLRYLPKHRYVLWALAITSPLAAALSAVGIRNVLHFR